MQNSVLAPILAVVIIAVLGLILSDQDAMHRSIIDLVASTLGQSLAIIQSFAATVFFVFGIIWLWRDLRKDRHKGEQ